MTQTPPGSNPTGPFVWWEENSAESLRKDLEKAISATSATKLETDQFLVEVLDLIAQLDRNNKLPNRRLKPIASIPEPKFYELRWKISVNGTNYGLRLTLTYHKGFWIGLGFLCKKLKGSPVGLRDLQNKSIAQGQANFLKFAKLLD